MKFHHIGIVVSELEPVVRFYGAIGYHQSQVFADSIQKVEIVLMDRLGEPLIELVMPSCHESPAYGWLKRIKSGPYHTCYEVLAIEPAVDALREFGFVPVSELSPAIAFSGRRVVFLWGQGIGLIELLEF